MHCNAASQIQNLTFHLERFRNYIIIINDDCDCDQICSSTRTTTSDQRRSKCTPSRSWSTTPSTSSSTTPSTSTTPWVAVSFHPSSWWWFAEANVLVNHSLQYGKPSWYANHLHWVGHPYHTLIRCIDWWPLGDHLVCCTYIRNFRVVAS